MPQALLTGTCLYVCTPLPLLPFVIMVFPPAKSNILSTHERLESPSVPKSNLQVKDSLIAVRVVLSTARIDCCQKKTLVSKCTWKSDFPVGSV